MANRRARRASMRANQGSQQGARSGIAQFAQDRPLLVAGAGIVLGMVLGALLPWDSIDEEYLGEQAEKLRDGALDLASGGYEKVKSAAQRTYDAASETIRGSSEGSSSQGTSSQGSSSGESTNSQGQSIRY